MAVTVQKGCRVIQVFCFYPQNTQNKQKEQSSFLSLKTRWSRAGFLCCPPAEKVLTFPAGGQAGSNGSLEPFEETGVSNIFAYFVYFVEESVSKSLPWTRVLNNNFPRGNCEFSKKI